MVSSVAVATVKIGIIGLGYWGPKLARNFANIPNSDLSVAVDLKQERLDEIQKLFPGTRTTIHSAELFQDGEVEAVVIATPVYSHFKLAKAALLAGKHVMIEKPLTRTSAEAQELVNIAKERGLTLMVGHTFEYNPAVEAVRDIIQSGELGEVYYINTTRVNLGLLQPDINVLWDLAPHDISILRFILNDDPVKAHAHGSVYINKNRPLYEIVYLNLIFSNGVFSNSRVSWLDPVKQRSITVVGSKKMLVYDDIKDIKIMIYDKGVEVPSYSVTEAEFHASYRNGSETPYPIEWVEPLRKECSHFVECILNHSEPLSNGISGLKVVKVLETAQRSLENGGAELRVEY